MAASNRTYKLNTFCKKSQPLVYQSSTLHQILALETPRLALKCHTETMRIRGMRVHLGEGGAVSHHELVGGGQAVGHVQEGQRSVRSQEARVAASGQRSMENFYRVICRAAPGKGRRGNDSGVAQRTKVHPVFSAVVLPQQLLVHLCRQFFSLEGN